MSEQTRTDSDTKLGAFVTNKWLVSAMLLLIMGMGGYIFRGIDKSGDAQASTIASVRSDLVVMERRLATAEIELATSRATQTAQYAEILRRLDGIDRYIYRNGPPR